MSSEREPSVWIEGPEIGRVAISETCVIGRSSSNEVLLNDERISRRHAVIYAHGHTGYWLTDPGSRNGVFHNGRRVTQAVRLRDGDQILVGPFQMVFRHPERADSSMTQTKSDTGTVLEVKPSNCWLLVVDLESSTSLSQRYSHDELPRITGQWLEQCKGIVEVKGGAIDKYLGDGFLAFWRAAPAAREAVAQALRDLRSFQSSSDLPFRIVLHYGRVFSGGVASSGLERFFGPEVNYVFKMERLASNLRTSCMASKAASEELKPALHFEEIGQYELSGFPGWFSFYQI